MRASLHNRSILAWTVLLPVAICAVTAHTASAQITPVTLQYFEGSWETIEDRTADIFMAGYGRIWVPPIIKGEGGGYSVGYNVFDFFDLGSPGSATRYGTRGGFEAVISEQDKAGVETFVDLVLNHVGNTDKNNTTFVAEGGYPGFVFNWAGDNEGDFHPRWDDCEADPINCRIAGLVDIAHEKNHTMIRHPVNAGDPQNIPAGTLRNKPSAANRALFSDLGLSANSIGIHPFNTGDANAGDPVTENATGLLMRHVRWLLEVIKVDGFRIDAAKHMDVWFLRDFYDRHAWNRKHNGGTPYSFMEYFDSNLGSLAYYACKGGQGNCNTSGGVSGNRDVLDFPLYWAMKNSLAGNGFGSWENIIGASADQLFDGNANNGNMGVQFVSAHDESLGPPGADNLAYAYILMRAGSPLVYFKAAEFGSVSFPRDGRGDALGGQFGDQILRLLDIHNEYIRGDYHERRDIGNPSFEDVLIFERWNACLIGINDRADGGYDQRAIATGFPAGLRLKELSGNATDSLVDPNNDIWDVVTVGSGGVATIRVPRNKNPNNVVHNRGYVMYGPINPDGELTLTPVAGTIAADPPSDPNGTRRLTEIQIIDAPTFEIRLETVDADAIDTGEDDLALFKMDWGIDLNNNGSVDNAASGILGGGYEAFLTEGITLESGGTNIGGVQKGLYRQTVDTSKLSEGRHYLTVVAFRSRPGGSPPIWETWKKVIYVDRTGPQMALSKPAVGETITAASFEFAVKCTDRTANAAHIFLDAAPGTDLVTLAQQGQSQASKVDRSEFRRAVSGLSRGNHKLDVVAFEPTGKVSVTTIPGVLVSLNGFDGLGDLNNDGKLTNIDIYPFINMVQQGNQFNPRADINGDGQVTTADVTGFADRMHDAGLSQALIDRVLRLADLEPASPAEPAPADKEANHG